MDDVVDIIDWIKIFDLREKLRGEWNVQSSLGNKPVTKLLKVWFFTYFYSEIRVSIIHMYILLHRPLK